MIRRGALRQWHQLRLFSISRPRLAIRPYMLADVGEGIKECEVIQWMVQPGARVDEFDPICELQSDKATVEITSRYTGVISKLHYEIGQMAQVGEPLLDIDVFDQEEEPASSSDTAEPENSSSDGISGTFQKPVSDDPGLTDSVGMIAEQVPGKDEGSTAPEGRSPLASSQASGRQPSKDPSIKTLATPAVRRVCRELSIDIEHVAGSGRDGRVLKEDVYKYSTSGKSEPLVPSSALDSLSSIPISSRAAASQENTIVPLKGVPKQMFKTMTASTQIPHFLFTDEIEMDRLIDMRTRINAQLQREGGVKLSFMPFLIKALSVALKSYPAVNTRLLVEEQALEYRSAHNIAIAINSPAGLVVPCIKDVANKSIFEVGQELVRLQDAAANGTLGAADFQNATITLSNIGTVGGTYVAPVIVDGQVAIGGIGMMRKLPRFDENDQVVARHIMCTSWSGDHRALDGVTLASMVTRWKQLVENPDEMLLHMQ